MKYKLWLIVCCTLLALSCRKQDASTQNHTVEKTDFYLGTVVEITAIGDKKEEIQQAIDRAFREVERIDSLMSCFKEDSEVSFLNREGSSRSVKVSHDTFLVIEESLLLSELSHGAFDITIAPLLCLWNSTGETGQLPGKEELKEAQSLVNYRNILLDEKLLTVRFKKQGTKIDLGGIAKGYAVDKAVGILKRQGINRAIVNAGGDLYLLGRPPRKEYWEIGIKHPREEKALLGIIKASDEAIATSGNYENFFVIEGKRYGHLFSPVKGTPSAEALSVTVLAKSALLADGLATAIFIMGPKAGLKLAESLDGIEAIVVREDKKPGTFAISVTEGIKERLTLNL